MGLCPPWEAPGFDWGQLTYTAPSQSTFQFLFAPYPAGHIDVVRLLVEWVIATLVAAALYFAWPRKASK
jgi:hypothetical protein